MGSDYIMESDDEVRRLEVKTDSSIVERFARRAGLGAGMRVVDAGCGPGATTTALAGIVGAGGSAVGFDILPKCVERAKAIRGVGNADYFVRDFRLPIEGIGSFDFAWVRFALEYYKAEAYDIVGNIAELLAPGGTLCLIDLDYNCLSHYGQSERLERALASVIAQTEERADFDPYAGRRLYSHLYKRGFGDITVEAGAHHCIYGPLRESDEFNWGKKIEVVSGKLDFDIPGYTGAKEFYEDFMAFFRDPARFTYTPVIMAWGRKPA
jgi:SAM-dependent methyltransferase